MTKTSASPTVPALRTETDGPIRWIVADNMPRLNAYTSAMWAAVPGLIRAAEADPSIKVIILRGAGEKAFSAGADISEFEAMNPAEQAARHNDPASSPFGAVEHCAKPTIAMIHGVCYGGGCELALCCDFRIASDTSSFSIPPAKLGIGYNARWIAPLLRVVSPAVAKEILFTGRRYDAASAERVGMVTRIVPTGDVMAETMALANTLAANAPLSILAAKRAIHALADPDGRVDMAALDAHVLACFLSDDYAEGRRAFMEKRKPVFRGK